MNRQEYYDLLVQTSKDGGFPSINENGCFYLHPSNGKRCAVGVLIPPDIIKETICMADANACNLRNMLELCPKISSYFPRDMTLDELSQVQNVHDLFDEDSWNHKKFVNKLNEMDCFRDIQQVNPQ